MTKNGSEPRNVDLVAIGGGTGLSTLLSGLKRYVGEARDRIAIAGESVLEEIGKQVRVFA